MKAPAVLALSAALTAAAACGAAPVEIGLDLPGLAALPAGAYGEIVVTDLAEPAPVPGFAAGTELSAYLAAELGRSFPGRVSRAAGPAAALAGQPPGAAWREAGAGLDRAVFLTGTVTLAGRVRKAVDKAAPSDGPFKRTLVERMQWTMTVDLVFVSAATGEAVHRTSLSEEREYTELDKPAEFAFSDLSQRVRDRLLPALLGTTTLERRTLLRR
ncbi:MAG: hypothetical protein MUE80_02670 [Acidobacteria bacterium]|nr:hypothetical protein [Acidobacteriota bacterium]